MTIDTDQLREFAQKATPGPWRASGRYIGNQNHMSCVGEVRDQNGNWSDTAKSISDAAFIAAANPTAILALLDELDRLRADLELACMNNDGMLRELYRVLELEPDELRFKWAMIAIGDLKKSSAAELNAAHLAGYRLAQAQAATACKSYSEEVLARTDPKNQHHSGAAIGLDKAADIIRAMQPPAEWGTE